MLNRLGPITRAFRTATRFQHVSPTFREPADHARAFRQKLLQRPWPRKQFCVYFTPRSGSSWLTDLLERSEGLCGPREAYNPNFLTESAASLAATDLATYTEILPRRFGKNDTFGFEITYYHMMRIYGSAEAFARQWGHATPIWIIREDIVLQAVSLQKMTSLGVAHSTSSDKDAVASADKRFRYDAAALRHWIGHLAVMESSTEAFFDAYDMSPLRLSYEVITGAEPRDVARALAAHVNAPSLGEIAQKDGHTKVGTDRNAEFAERFRAENAEFLAGIDAGRRKTLDGVVRDLPSVWEGTRFRNPKR